MKIGEAPRSNGTQIKRPFDVNSNYCSMFSIDGFLRYCMTLTLLTRFSFVWAMSGHELRM